MAEQACQNQPRPQGLFQYSGGMRRKELWDRGKSQRLFYKRVNVIVKISVLQIQYCFNGKESMLWKVLQELNIAV